MIKTDLPGKKPSEAVLSPSEETPTAPTTVHSRNASAAATTASSESAPTTVLTCYQCGRSLSADEIALHKRIINRGADSHLCLTCLAAFFDCNEDLLRNKIEHFRKMGCTLFEPNTRN